MNSTVNKIVFLAVALASASAVNAQLTNGGFEADPAGGPGSPITGWLNFNQAFASNEYARTGVNSLKSYGPFTQFAGSVAVQDFTPAVGQPLTIRGYGLTPLNDRVQATNFGFLKVEFFNSSNASLGAVEQRVDIGSTPDVWNLLTLQSTVPTGTSRASVIAGHVQLASPALGGAVFFDDIEIVTAGGPSTWSVNSSGDYFAAGNWSAGQIPNAVGAEAVFGSVITAPRTVYADQAVTLGRLNFNNASRYQLTGNGTLTMDATTGSAAINLTAGSHKINLPLTLNDNTNANVATGTTLVIADPLTLANGSQLNISGGGTVQIISTVTSSGPASINTSAGRLQADMNLNGVAVNVTGGEARFSASQNLSSLAVSNGSAVIENVASSRVVKTASLTMGTGGKLNLTDNGLIVDYTGASPLAAVRAAIASAYAAGAWTGNGIGSSVAAVDTLTGVGFAEASALGSPSTFLGESVDATSILVRLTLKGDADLNGSVNFSDLLRVAQNYDLAGSWVQGDSNYDGLVGFADLLAIAQNYDRSLLSADTTQLSDAGSVKFVSDFALAVSLVPEPTTLSVIALAASAMMRRRR